MDYWMVHTTPPKGPRLECHGEQHYDKNVSTVGPVVGNETTQQQAKQKDFGVSPLLNAIDARKTCQEKSDD
jgi:hypothetical protein